MTTSWLVPLAFFTWPLVAFWLYHIMPVGKATLWTIVGAQLLLPPNVSYKFPMIPAIDKASVATAAALLGCLFVARRRIRFFTKIGFAELLILMFILSPIVTSALNNDAVVAGGAVLPGVGFYDGFSAALGQFTVLLPFVLGRQLLRSVEDNSDIMRVLVIAGLFYSLPMWFELRMSPILNIWIYGYAPIDMQQVFRDGGYRPMVFIGHSLSAAFFMMTTVIAAAALWQTKTRIRRLSSAGVTAYLTLMLLLCKSAASVLYGALGALLILLTKPRTQIRVAAVLAALALAYPMLRSADLVPTKVIVNEVASFSGDRAGSLNTRFSSEDELLARAEQRFVFGWGRYGRSRTYGDTGQFYSITDGAWIITVGTFGLVGFLTLFGLLTLPIFRAISALKSVTSERDAVFLAALTLIAAFDVFDLLPNSGLTPPVWLFAGALLGRTEALKATERRSKRLEPVGIDRENVRPLTKPYSRAEERTSF